MTTLALDHLVIAAGSLEQGVDWCRRTLGVTPGPGGRHALMGTHNRLFALAGDEHPRAYAEIIAIDPQAEPPPRPRWFGLDTPALRQAIAHEPRLVHWVARSDALEDDLRVMRGHGFDAGEPTAASRGDLRWRITIPADGGLWLGGALPSLIEWQGAHPTQTMDAPTVALRALRLRGLPPTLAASLGLRRWCMDAAVPGFDVELAVPGGRVVSLSSFRNDAPQGQGTTDGGGFDGR